MTVLMKLMDSIDKGDKHEFTASEVIYLLSCELENETQQIKNTFEAGGRYEYSEKFTGNCLNPYPNLETYLSTLKSK